MVSYDFDTIYQVFNLNFVGSYVILVGFNIISNLGSYMILDEGINMVTNVGSSMTFF